MTFENRLDKVLGLVSEDNDISTGAEKAKPVELEGKKKRSADGPHRPDSPTGHTEHQPDAEEFENNPHKLSDQARPELTSDFE